MVDKKKAEFADMQKLAEQAYETSLHDLPALIDWAIESYEMSSILKVNIINIATTCVLNNFYRENHFEMNDAEIQTSKWTLIKMLFPDLGDGPISILKWNNMLSPTSEPYFKSIFQDIFEEVQGNAKLLLERAESNRENFPDEQIEHWKKIVAGEVPYGYTIVNNIPEPTNPE